MNSKLFFIVGSGRCGTNLLRNILNIHPAIHVITETHFISTLISKFSDNDFSFDQFYSCIYEHYRSTGDRWIDVHLDAGGKIRKNFYKEFKQFCIKRRLTYANTKQFTEAFFEYCYNFDKKILLIGDKTPKYGIHMYSIKMMWNDAKFIHIVRDGRFVAISMLKHSGIRRIIGLGFPIKISEYSYKGLNCLSDIRKDIKFCDCINYWYNIIKIIRKKAKLIPKESYIEIRYEDLVAFPIFELIKIAKFLKVQFVLVQQEFE